MKSRGHRVAHLATLIAIISLLTVALPGLGIAQERVGAWVDTVLAIQESNDAAAVSRLEANDIQAWFADTSLPDLRDRIARNPALTSTSSFGLSRELTFNPVGPVFPGTEKLNPFSSAKIREAMNWLIDRRFIVEEILHGMGKPRYLPINSGFPDYARMADVARQIEIRYAPNPTKARAVISAEMGKLGATLVDGKWQYKGRPVILTFLIRSEDDRKAIGDYVARLLEGQGFTVERRLGTSSDLSPIWNSGDPAKGLWHLYTGGWIWLVIVRSESGIFDSYFTPRGDQRPLWQAYKPSPEFDRLADRLGRSDYSTMAERHTMFARALELSMEDSVRIFLAEEASVSPRRAEVKVVADLAGGVTGSLLWPYTIRYAGRSGGTLRIALRNLLTEPWNALGGANNIFDGALYHATQDYATIRDPYTGLDLPQRIERAEVFVKQGLPVTKTLDWVSLQRVPEIRVPQDAFISWDPKAQRFLTVGDKYPQGLTARTKAVVYFERDLFKKVQWHDGTPLSLGDMMLNWILTFDTAMEASPIYDASSVPSFQSFEQTFRGFRIVQKDPLVAEIYSDGFGLDAEGIAAGAAGAFWPTGLGPAPWHTVTLGIRAEAAGEAAFTADKASEKKLEQLNYIAGPTLAVLDRHLAAAREQNYIPYAPTLSKYITPDEAKTRWTLLTHWREGRGHYWVGMGPFLLQRVSPVEKIVELHRFSRFPDPSTKWVRFEEPKLAAVAASGPATVRIGDEVPVDVRITFQNRPYPAEDIAEVKFLLFDAKSELITTGVATHDGEKWSITLSPQITRRLGAGANRLEVIVVSRAVSIPSFATFSFTTLPR
ncbi:MAG TPA: ABC transporter substrate-binding protein [bacterium]|nr:ABC transporter substrate-binding protein [bacterium]